jgi:hypothetical protein
MKSVQKVLSKLPMADLLAIALAAARVRSKRALPRAAVCTHLCRPLHSVLGNCRLEFYRAER